MSIGIAYNPCKSCKEMDKCSICELTYYRKGCIKSPTTDVVEVVRCKDCVHWGGVTYGFMCSKFSGIDTKICMGADHYCSYGRKKDDGT